MNAPDDTKSDAPAHGSNGTNGELATTADEAARAWSDVAADANRAARGTREKTRVDPSITTIRTDPSILPDTPRESHGLFELVPAVARRALELGLAAREPSFHVFVAAQPDVMIEDDVVRYAERFASRRRAPDDIVYVHDFDRPEAPIPLRLPAGMGPMLEEAMGEVVDRLVAEMPGIAQDEGVTSAEREHSAKLEERHKAVIRDLEQAAKHLGFGVRAVEGGLQTFPVLHGKPVSPEQFDVLDESTKRALAGAEGRLTREVEKAARLVRAATEAFEVEKTTALGKAAEVLIAKVVDEVLAPFRSVSDALAAYLERMQAELTNDWQDLAVGDSEPGGEEGGEDGKNDDPELATRLARFRVNVLISNDPEDTAPVIYETNPTYPNLFGYLERRARYGALLTDFTRIRAGALHKASGGVLVVRAADLLTDPILWERMKRVLRERRIGAEDPLGPLGLYATTLRPVPVRIDVRIILVGPPDLYAQLLDSDADFAALFRVKVEVEPSIARTEETMRSLDAYVMNMAKDREWGTFDRGARARLLDIATRLAGDRDKLALSLSPLEETAAFASALSAARALGGESAAALPDVGDDDDEESPAPFRASIRPPDSSIVTADDVDIAWRERRERLGAAERHIREVTLRGEVALDTSGGRVGVVNGLSVFSTGDVEFGQPMRITAVVALGREGIVDVERESQLGGSIHTKGVAILRGYLARIFGQERPLSLRAQLAFEQSYGEIDGDSASSSELFAVLSALADVPIEQGIAVTGSVNQLGEVQAIGGVCAKIEGFYDLCAARGLTGTQGVLFPRSNLPHLVLREDVATAIREGKFNLYVMTDVVEGIELLTGLVAGERDAAGRFPAASLFGRVERRIIEIAERLREAEGHHVHPGARETETDVNPIATDGADFRGR